MEQQYPSRKRLRLLSYNYSAAGTYFLTLCTKNKQPLLCRFFGFDSNGVPVRKQTAAGAVAEKYLMQIPHHYPNVQLDHWVVMPNHIHMLLTVLEENGAPGSSRPTQTVPKIIGAFKRLSDREAGDRLWQACYFDHVIRNEQDYLRCWAYIENNPFRWAEDRYYV